MNKEWTSHEDRRLREMHTGNMTFSQIGLALGRSKNSIVGRVRRLGLAPRPSPIRNKSRPAADDHVSNLPTRISPCQYIKGHVPECLDADGNAPFCAKPAYGKSPYCEEHHALCYEPYQRNPQSAKMDFNVGF